MHPEITIYGCILFLAAVSIGFIWYAVGLRKQLRRIVHRALCRRADLDLALPVIRKAINLAYANIDSGRFRKDFECTIACDRLREADRRLGELLISLETPPRPVGPPVEEVKLGGGCRTKKR